jgi:L-lactate dehydrogenase
MVFGQYCRRADPGAAFTAEIILRDERVAIPIGCYSPEYGVTLSLPSIVGREGVVRTLDPELSMEERQGLLRSVDTLKAALRQIKQSELQPS